MKNKHIDIRNILSYKHLMPSYCKLICNEYHNNIYLWNPKNRTWSYYLFCQETGISLDPIHFKSDFDIDHPHSFENTIKTGGNQCYDTIEDLIAANFELLI